MLSSKIESLLFISGRPMSARELSELAKADIKQIEEAGNELIKNYQEKNAGTRIIKNGSNYQMVTAPDNAELIQQFVKDETTGELTRPSLETLTIIAYRGPVSKTDLDRIRGINCSLILRNLLIRGLIEMRENKKIDESYYTITFDFLRFLGLNEVKELPDYERLSKDDTIDRILDEGVANIGMGNGFVNDSKTVKSELGTSESGNEDTVGITGAEDEEKEFEDDEEDKE